MQVTFYPRKQKDGKIVAFADVVVTEGITVRGFRVVNGDNGLFAAVPSKSYSVDGETRFANQVVFTSLELRERFLSELLDGYHRWRETREAADNFGVDPVMMKPDQGAPF